jgi:cysteine desulfurase family protein (TIGR01976 family)
MTTNLDLNFVRSQFPAFSEPTLKGFAHFENAGGSYACGQTIEHLDRFYRETKLQPYYDFAPSRRGGELMDQARARMAGWMNVRPDEVHFGPSTSMNHYVVAQALRGYLKPGDEFIVTNQDHEANVGVWRRLEADGIVIREWPVDPVSGELDPADLTRLLNQNTRVVAFTHCSNLVGSIHPVRQLTDRVHQVGALAIVDGVSYAPHGIPDPVELGADIYTYSTYKTYGPHLGVMYMASSLNETLPNQGHFFNAEKATARFTPAGPDHAQVAAVNGVIDYLELLHDHHFDEGDTPLSGKGRRVAQLMHDQESSLLPPLLEFVDQHPRTRLIGRAGNTNRAPTVAFAIEGQTPAELARKLGDEGIGVGVGDFYARRLVEALNIDPSGGVVRCSFVHYTSPEEVSRLIDALDRLL